MAVAFVQQATASSLSASSLTATLGSTPSVSNAVILVINSTASINSVSGGLANLGEIDYFGNTLSVYRLYSTGPTSATVNFSALSSCCLWYAEYSGVNTSYFSSSLFGVTTPSLTVDTPTTQLQVAGDIPLAAWSGLTAMTATAQAGWAELAQLNNSSSAVLEIQQGPAATGTQQAYTTQVTWSTTNPPSLGIAITLSGGLDVGLMSQEVVETLASDTPNARLSQEVAEVVATDTSAGQMSQEVVETLAQDTANSQLSQWVIELLIQLFVHVSQEVVEVLARDTANAHVSQVVVEVIWSSQGARRRVVDDEMFTY